MLLLLIIKLRGLYEINYKHPMGAGWIDFLANTIFREMVSNFYAARSI